MNKNSHDKLNLQVGETLLAFFLRSISEDKTISNIVNVLSVLNSFILIHPGSMSQEIFEFGNYFIANGFEERTKKAREREFGKEAYILDRYYAIAEKMEEQEVLATIADLTFDERQEAMTLTNAVFNISGYKTVTLSTDDGPISFTYHKVLKPSEIESLRQELFNYMAYAIKLGNAGIVVRLKKSSTRDELLGLTIQNGKWRPLRVFELMETIKGDLDIGVRYTELPM